MSELEIFLFSSIENILYLHNDGGEPECKCSQCKLARQTLAAAEQNVQATKARCICVDFINCNPDPVSNPDCPIHGKLPLTA